jgi:hypothetical protein
MAYDADGFVKGLRAIYQAGAFALNFGGSKHNIVYTPGLAAVVLNAKKEFLDQEEISRRLMDVVFGFPPAEFDKYDAALPELVACYKEILSNPGLSNTVQQLVQKTQENASNLVTFLDSPVDQMPWEKTANTSVLPEGPGGEPVAEVSLLHLIRDFCGFTANPSIIGSDFLSNYPEYFDDLWALDGGFLLLATGLPRWAPIPSLTRAHISKKRNLERLDTFHEALEKHWNGAPVESKWSSLDDISGLIKARMHVYHKHDFSIRARAAVEHALLWAANANANVLVFWMLNHIYADGALLARLREELDPYVTVAHDDDSELPIKSPPRISALDVDAICANCVLLKSVYVESFRLDAAPWSFKSVKSDFVLQARDPKGAAVPSEAWLLRKGEFVHAAHDLHNTDPNYFDEPLAFKADRHIRYERDDDGRERATADLGSIRPYGGGASMCKGRAVALKEIMMFTAAIIYMWDMEPKGGGKWKMPKHQKATAVYATNDDVRVWVKRRKFALGQI